MNHLNQKGVSLIEVVIGAALVGVLAAAIAGIGAIISQGMRKAQNTQDEYNIANQLRTFLENEQSCRLALGGPAAFGGTAGTSPYSQVVAATGQTALKLYQPLPVNVNRVIFLDASSSALRSFNGMNTAANTLGNWTANSITIEPETATFTGAGYFPALIRIQIKPTRETTTFGTLNLPAMRLMVQLDAALNIISCLPATYASDGTPIPVCPPGWAPNTTTDILGTATAAGPYLDCRRIACDPGHFPLGGWDAWGNMLCSP